MRILSQYTEAVTVGGSIWLIAALSIAMVGTLSFALVLFRASYKGIALILAITTIILCIAQQNLIRRKEEVTRLKVIVDEKVDVYDFLDGYKIIERQGDILTLEEIAPKEEARADGA